MHDAGIEVDMITGFKNKDLVILQDEFRAGTDHLYLVTDDGTAGEKMFTTEKLQKLIDGGEKYDEVIAVGPPIMRFHTGSSPDMHIHIRKRDPSDEGNRSR